LNRRLQSQTPDDQETALDDLRAASSQASDIVKSSCPSSDPLTPVGRLDTAKQRLEATIKAIQIIRPPPIPHWFGAVLSRIANDDQIPSWIWLAPASGALPEHVMSGEVVDFYGMRYAVPEASPGRMRFRKSLACRSLVPPLVPNEVYLSI
jgi:hypothetical protein